MRAVGYARVSTAGQVKNGVSLELQRERIGAWCEANGHALMGMHVDAGVSGAKVENRPALQAALAAATTTQAALVCYSLSRLARSTRDAITISERLSKAGADLVSLSERIDTTTAAGKMVFRMLAVLAEFERDIIAERTASAMHHKRARGEYTGGRVPYGWRLAADGVALMADPSEQALIRAARATRRWRLAASDWHAARSRWALPAQRRALARQDRVRPARRSRGVRHAWRGPRRRAPSA